MPAGVQAGHRAGESGVKGFGIVRGLLTQPLFNMAVPPSLRRGDVEVLIAQQKLNVAVVEQIHAARLAFYAALYNRSLESIRDEQRQKLQQNVTTQKERFEAGLADKSAFTSATVQADELVPQVERAHRAYREAQLKLAEAMAIDPAKSSLPEPEGELEFISMRLDPASETVAALQRRADLKLARLFVRAANEDERIIAADYYPAASWEAFLASTFPVTGIHRQGSTSKTQDFIGSEIREKAAYTWRVIDNGKVGGAVSKARAAREDERIDVQETGSQCQPRTVADCQRPSGNRSPRKLALGSLSRCRRKRPDGTGKCCQRPRLTLEYRVSENAFLKTRSGLLDAVYQHNLAVAEWDRATGRYFQFSDETAASPGNAGNSLTLKRYIGCHSVL